MKQLASLWVAAIAIATMSFAAETENNNDAPLAEVRKAIDKGNAQWIEAWDKADANMISNLFAEDGVLLGRNGTMFKGRQQILERLKTVMGTGKAVKATVTSMDLWLDGNTAYETGKYTYKLPMQEEAQSAIEEGYYATIWKRQHDGSWRIVMDMGIPKS